MASTDKPTRIAIVTGAAQGIGKAIALRLAKDGLDVAINDLPRMQEQLTAVSEEIRAMGRNSSIHLADMSNEEEIRTMFNEVIEKYGGLDVMVANAGVCLMTSFLDMPLELYDKTFAINSRSVFLCYQLAAKQMVKQGRGGRIIGASSFGGKSGVQHESLTAYVGTKFAVRGMTQAVAGELGKYGITVNAYAPGLVDTEMARQYVEKHAKEYGIPPEQFAATYYSQVPVRHGGSPEDVAGLVSYLASEESSFMTGQTVSINGGVFCD
ncbi:NAD(P)-binding protein [Dendrothele bispora CBS 962.96]|uniref:NAD(P)-binding protein n=1 Tax=Dendrothele bispora (strain CBS 962.96) TaxID=1314807 RepID=A0A4S8MRK3_DENBC|nr:NAD(P)-binding protein [Dendrothele bispora CBS 962.96]